MNISRIVLKNSNKGIIVQTGAQFSTTSPEFKSQLDVKSPNYQYLQRSRVRSEKFQTSLPRLPIPKLDKTCERYLDSQKAILNEEQFGKTKAIVDDFSKSGKALQKELQAINKANKHTSYITGPWTDMYLKDRRAVSFNHNPGILLADDPRPEMMKVDARMTNVLISSLRFHKSLRESILTPDVYHMNPRKTNNPIFWDKVKFIPEMMATPITYLLKVFPLDMSQHPNLFQSTRIPLKEKDKLERFPDSKHILMMRKGHFYTFPVYDDNWNLFDPGYYLDSIRSILNDNPPEASGIGILTSMDRDQWAEARQHLDALGNQEQLRLIDSALFNICLDDDFTSSQEDPSLTVRNLVSGLNPINRWFDKSFSLICAQNGVMGLNFEHAWGDGVAVMRYMDEMIQDSQKNDFISAKSGSGADPNISRLEIKTDEKMKNIVKQAEEDFRKKCSSVTFNFLGMTGIGKNLCKKNKIGPDSFMQAVLQVAYHRMRGQFAPTYESCSTAIYKHGRTETIRPCTMQTSTLARTVNAKPGSIKPDEFKALMEACSKKHFELTKSCAQGQGWDRHLFALKNLASKAGGTLPKIFQDDNYKQINHIIISTSTLSTPNIVGGAFCPVVPDGFGVGYAIRDDQLGFNVSSYKEHTNGPEFCDAITETVTEFQRVLQS